MSTEAVIAGVGETPYERHPSRTTTTHRLLAAAARSALQSANVAPSEVDGLGVASFSLAPDRGIDIALRLGLRLRWLMDGATGGASALDMLQHARRAVEAGDAHVILLVSGDRFEASEFAHLVDEFNVATREHLTPLPTGGPNALFALLTRRHMHAHGLGRETYGTVAVAQRAWAAGNPNAAYRSTLTLADYLAAPVVADPLTIYDCVPVVAGADAVVVAADDRGRRPAIRIRSLVVGHNADNQDGDGLATGLRALRDELWDTASAGPDDVDLVSVYDDYTAMALVQLEDLGFASGGDVGRLVAERISTRELPLNTSGGQLSAGQAGAAGGMHGLVEVVTQLRGEGGRRQVAGARLGVVSGYGMVAYRYGACANAAVLERA